MIEKLSFKTLHNNFGQRRIHGVGDGVFEGSGVGVAVGNWVGVAFGVGVAVGRGVGVAVGAGGLVGAGVFDGVGLGVAVALGVGILFSLSVGVGLEAFPDGAGGPNASVLAPATCPSLRFSIGLNSFASSVPLSPPGPRNHANPMTTAKNIRSPSTERATVFLFLPTTGSASPSSKNLIAIDSSCASIRILLYDDCNCVVK